LRASTHSIALRGLTADIAAQFGQRETSCPNRGSYDVFIAKRFTDHLAARGLLKPPPSLTERELARAGLQSDYEDHLRRQRGLSEPTIYHCWRFADRFLNFRFEAADVTLSAIVPGDVVAFLQQLTSRKAPFRDKTPPTHLRNVLKYLFRAGLTPSNLALCVPSVAQRYNANLPRHIAPDQVEAVLATVRADELVGRRNYAMVLLLARFALRAAEVVAMQLDDIDWRAGELVVRGKGKNHDRVPLPPDVGEALEAYVQQDRKSTSRALFVSSREPHRPFKDGRCSTPSSRRHSPAPGWRRYAGTWDPMFCGTAWQSTWCARARHWQRSLTCSPIGVSIRRVSPGISDPAW